MPQQPESTSSTLAVSPAPLPGSAVEPARVETPLPSGHTPPRIPRWLERFERTLRVMLRIYIGCALCCAPWTRFFWDQNPLFLQFPSLGSLAASGAVRGVVSGLGLLNLWVALQDILGRRGMSDERYEAVQRQQR